MCYVFVFMLLKHLNTMEKIEYIQRAFAVNSHGFHI